MADADAYLNKKLTLARAAHAEEGPLSDAASQARRVARHACKEVVNTRGELAKVSASSTELETSATAPATAPACSQLPLL